MQGQLGVEDEEVHERIGRKKRQGRIMCHPTT